MIRFRIFNFFLYISFIRLKLATNQGTASLIFFDDVMNIDSSVPKNFQAMAISIALTS